MPTYAIGDPQGCFDELQQLLRRCRFDAARDRLWVVGDLVNRGPRSLEVLRWVRSLGERAVVVLGNHDLHLVSRYEGFGELREDDTFADVLAAADAGELVAWLRTRPLMHVEGGYAMVHAGLAPQWSVQKAHALAGEVEAALAGSSYRDFLANLYGSKPDTWSEALSGWDRLRVIVNVMTRMRFCTAEGKLDFKAKGTTAPPGYAPWFTHRRGDTHYVVAGHWSALGLRVTEQAALLDSGCVWGGSLSALRLEDRKVFRLSCRGHRIPGRNE